MKIWSIIIPSTLYLLCLINQLETLQQKMILNSFV